MTNDAASSPAPLSALPRYRTSAVARMTGIPVASLRVWERRYQIVGPSRAESGHRLYSHDDVRRLLMIKRLVDLGNPVGSLARLNVIELQRMLEQADDLEAAGQGGQLTTTIRPTRVAVIGEGLAAWARQRQAWPESVEIVGAVDWMPGAAVAVEAQARQIRADLLVVEVHGLHPEAAQQAVRISRHVGARHVVVIFGFGPGAEVDALQARGWVLRRAPVGPADLDALLLDGARALAGRSSAVITPAAVAPPRRFEPGTLMGLAESLPPVACECPRHLAELVMMLAQFEDYSADCENLQPHDAALHDYLHRVAGTARAMFEEALARVAQAEGVPLPTAPSP